MGADMSIAGRSRVSQNNIVYALILIYIHSIVNGGTPYSIVCVKATVSVTASFHTPYSILSGIDGIALEKALSVNVCRSQCLEGLSMLLYQMNYICERHETGQTDEILRTCTSANIFPCSALNSFIRRPGKTHGPDGIVYNGIRLPVHEIPDASPQEGSPSGQRPRQRCLRRSIHRGRRGHTLPFTRFR